MHTKSFITLIIGVAGIAAAPTEPGKYGSDGDGGGGSSGQPQPQAQGQSVSSSFHTDSNNPNPVGSTTSAQWQQNGNQPPVGSIQSSQFGTPQQQQPGTGLLSSPGQGGSGSPPNFQPQHMQSTNWQQPNAPGGMGGAGNGIQPIFQGTAQQPPAGGTRFGGSPPPAWPLGHGIVSPQQNQQPGVPGTNGLQNMRGASGYPHGQQGGSPFQGGGVSSPQNLPQQQDNGPTLGGTGQPQIFPQQNGQPGGGVGAGLGGSPPGQISPNQFQGGAGGNPMPQQIPNQGSPNQFQSSPQGGSPPPFSGAGGSPQLQGGAGGSPFGQQGPGQQGPGAGIGGGVGGGPGPGGIRGSFNGIAPGPFPGINTNGQPRNVPPQLGDQLLYVSSNVIQSSALM